MANPVQVRTLLETVHEIDRFLTEKEVYDIAIVLNKAIERILKENGGE